MNRPLQLALAVACLIFFGPVILASAAWVKLSSPGPVFFRQTRVGLHGKPFLIWKLRTMSVPKPGVKQSSVTVMNDPRLIFGGAMLRHLKIDELPQLFNVLSGQMAFVGPRPTVDEDHQRMTPEQRRRTDALPGITGLAQINGGTAIPWPQRIVWDLQYVQRRSLWLDLRILASTVLMTLNGSASQHPPCDDEWATESQTDSHSPAAA